MMTLLSPRVWVAIAIAAIFAACNFGSYRAGRANVRAAWDAEKVVVAAAVLKQTEAAREKEQALQATVTKAQNDAKQREITFKADAGLVRAVNDSLRSQLATADSELSSATVSACRGYATTANAVLGECSSEVERLAGQAQGNASTALMLQQAWPK